MRLVAVVSFVLASTAMAATKTNVATESVMPGTAVTRGGQKVTLEGGTKGLQLNAPLPATALTDMSWAPYSFKADGIVKLVSIVPSVDTSVCGEQTHMLGETAKLDPRIERITVSRDLPAAQKRFATEAKTSNVKYLSDYRSGEFGKATGLLMQGSDLLARAVLVVDGEGKVRYMQVVPEVASLPDMEKAFAEANKLVK